MNNFLPKYNNNNRRKKMLFGLIGDKAPKNVLNNPISIQVDFGGKTLTLETNRFAKQATGSVMATMGGTMVLATVVAARSAKEGQDFFPLTVDYTEKMASAGRIPGSRDRREGRASLNETLTARLIDRPIRPLFPETFKNETQIVATVFSYDRENQPDILAMIASSAALAISGIPFMGPIGAARVGFVNGEYILNPSRKEVMDSELELVVAGTKDGVLMVESEAGELTEEEMLGAVKFGFDAFQPVIGAINELKEAAGKAAWDVLGQPAEYVQLESDLERFADRISDALTIAAKMDRYAEMDAIKADARDSIADATDLQKLWANEIIEGITSRIMRRNILDKKPRIDGRDSKTVRPIEVEVGVLPRTHGSALFTRGETQALVTLTLGNDKDARPIESMDGASDDRFILDYNFPPFSVGEVGRIGAPKRRELGHGKLAWRAINPMLPSKEQFDYTIRAVSDVLESNGSSSMATVCGTTLALMDGGVPMVRPVAGIAMGLIKEGDEFEVLTDIMGDEDHLGDMDFKVTGTDKGVTALQMDIKITSITFDIMKRALAQAKDGRLHILGIMNKAIKSPRKELSKFAPQTFVMKINPDKIREVIGKGGSVIQALTKETNTSIDITDDGTIKIMATDKSDADNAMARIKEITAEPEVGQIYEGVVSGLKDFGLFVKIMNGNFESLVHISEITGERLNKIEDAKLKEGDKVFVKYLGVDKRGKTRLSMVGINQKTGKEEK
ncbi:MAG: polyribonucleotide nucleotidyltransferase [Rickettsiales bacterium]|jgi:polyribonucleotide nucleotidyltransferase|nr:polyribonucleotide nucleotidyltransferase [Rickettsiales bacterium]